MIRDGNDDTCCATGAVGSRGGGGGLVGSGAAAAVDSGARRTSARWSSRRSIFELRMRFAAVIEDGKVVADDDAKLLLGLFVHLKSPT